MQFANYSEFRTAMQTLIEGDDTAGGTFSTATLDLMIGLGEQRVYRDLRASAMLADLSATVTDNAAALPADLLELKEAWFDGNPPLEVVPLDRLRTMEARGSGGDSRYCAQDGDTLRFWPPASGTVLGRYYARQADLKAGTWAELTAFARYPEVFMYAAMVEALPYLGLEAKAPLWEAKYQQSLALANQDERVRVYGGGQLRVRSR